MKRKAAQNSGAERKKMPRGNRFKKGRSGNPGGRPKLPDDVKEYLRLNTSQMTIEALEALRMWAQSFDGKVAVPAALGLLKKTLPDGTIKIELTGAEGGPLESRQEVTLDDSPEGLSRVLAILQSSGALEPEDDGEGADAEADEIHHPETH
jgi:hypothetical protein